MASARSSHLITAITAGLFGAAGGYYWRGRTISQTNSHGNVDPAIIKKIEDGYKILQGDPKCKSLLKKHFTKDVLEALKDKKTSMGATLWVRILFISSEF
jgi:hypothetical protein